MDTLQVVFIGRDILKKTEQLEELLTDYQGFVEEIAIFDYHDEFTKASQSFEALLPAIEKEFESISEPKEIEQKQCVKESIMKSNEVFHSLECLFRQKKNETILQKLFTVILQELFEIKNQNLEIEKKLNEHLFLVNDFLLHQTGEGIEHMKTEMDAAFHGAYERLLEQMKDVHKSYLKSHDAAEILHLTEKTLKQEHLISKQQAIILQQRAKLHVQTNLMEKQEKEILIIKQTGEEKLEKEKLKVKMCMSYQKYSPEDWDLIQKAIKEENYQSLEEFETKYENYTYEPPEETVEEVKSSGWFY